MHMGQKSKTKFGATDLERYCPTSFNLIKLSFVGKNRNGRRTAEPFLYFSLLLILFINVNKNTELQ
jgi:hypothetical protein